MNYGIYIHIPFCRSKCRYCSFLSQPLDPALAERYRHAVVGEMEHYAAELGAGDAADTIYVGGGTPSLLPVSHLGGILAACRRLFKVSETCEISLEANPGTLDRDKAAAFLSMGVNRISLGAQSFDDGELRAIGRIHKAAAIRDSAALIRSIGIRLSLDLILGLPGQTEERWLANLDRASALDPSHLSVYMLELDEKSALHREVSSGRCILPDDDAMADWYLLTIDYLGRRGYRQYEISNFARPGCESIHNLKYWGRAPVLGFGVGSHSYDGRSRFANTRDLEAYLSAVEGGSVPVEWRTPMSPAQELEETLFLGLRLNRGIDWKAVSASYGKDLTGPREESIVEMAERGLLERDGDVVRLTRQGMLLSNEVFQAFIQ